MLMTGGLVVNAGRDTTLGSLGGTITVGGSPTASGGSTPYSYLWTPVNRFEQCNNCQPGCHSVDQYYLYRKGNR